MNAEERRAVFVPPHDPDWRYARHFRYYQVVAVNKRNFGWTIPLRHPDGLPAFTPRESPCVETR
jgi:hypothetical protein